MRRTDLNNLIVAFRGFLKGPINHRGFCLGQNLGRSNAAWNIKVKQSRYRPRSFQEVKVPRFRDSGTGWW